MKGVVEMEAKVKALGLCEVYEGIRMSSWEYDTPLKVLTNREGEPFVYYKDFGPKCRVFYTEKYLNETSLGVLVAKHKSYNV